MSISCYIYRCSAKTDMYIYLAEENGFDTIDEGLLKTLGQLNFAMTIELNENTRLAKENPIRVMENIQTQGFHLQLPPETSVEELLTKIAEKRNAK